MAEIGSITVGVDATAVKAKSVFKELSRLTAGFKAGLVSLANHEMGQGSALAKGITFVREQFLETIDHLKETKKAAEDLGLTIEEYSGGLVTKEDVENADQLTEDFNALNEMTKHLRDSIFIRLEPGVSDAILVLQHLLKQLDRYFEWSEKQGAKVGNVLAPDHQNAGQVGTTAALDAFMTASGGTNPTTAMMWAAARQFMSRGRLEPMHSPQQRSRINAALAPDTSRLDELIEETKKQTEVMKGLEGDVLTTTGGLN